MKKHWIAIDWGTTNFRAFLLQDQRVIAKIAHPCGLLSMTKETFATTLGAHLTPWLDEYGPLPIVMAGMVGSQQGWQEVPYVVAPAGAQRLAKRAMRIATPWESPAWITPGVSTVSQFGLPDVMRGEEVQLLGLNALHPETQRVVILPGTHSKHSHLSYGEITQFSTFMTGELFSVLSKHSLLGRVLPEQQNDKDSFINGVNTAQRGTPFSHLIFSARTRRLTGELAPQHIHSYLSGLLIGYELAAVDNENTLWVVGSPTLTARYQLAAQTLQIPLHAADGDTCFIHGMATLQTFLEETES
ncbi:2-dehydro-3-deoxygalactonokinase [Kluyvera intermedia]|uniref:2-dehydro-3-deoxygalactonokinase n=1 Tax=Kluyvera intermedia TaxID=61648 RepID=UPI001F27402C|nr:2-dehydro-3-deoxygalactonokinase [Kluyvera intermedia]MCE9889143.1 2-dehydro-3-deoxygalactonokinase [Kluyvera intermedia]